MKKNFIFLVFLASFAQTLIFSKCPPDEKGCTDSKALNKDYSAVADDGSCTYSNVTFYASAGFFYGVPITKIDVTVNGNIIGSINGGSFWPSGPGNCSASGTVSYKFTSGGKVDWNATIYLASGATNLSSGQVSPSSASDCIKINVTS